mmetsp:Transcript_35821/g.61084  ORF Transcript_35821/g.61084 Transcript_35821/m.61084 type:complete len:101 (-) Transcript_35821:42-344(-)
MSETRTKRKGSSAELSRAGWRKWYTGTGTDRTFFVVTSTSVSGCVAMGVRRIRWGDRRRLGSQDAEAPQAADTGPSCGSSGQACGFGTTRTSDSSVAERT